jgi:hypothetical protein
LTMFKQFLLEALKDIYGAVRSVSLPQTVPAGGGST